MYLHFFMFLDIILFPQTVVEILPMKSMELYIHHIGQISMMVLTLIDKVEHFHAPGLFTSDPTTKFYFGFSLFLLKEIHKVNKLLINIDIFLKNCIDFSVF